MPTSPTPTPVAPTELDMSRAVIEHALIDVDRLIAEARAE